MLGWSGREEDGLVVGVTAVLVYGTQGRRQLDPNPKFLAGSWESTG